MRGFRLSSVLRARKAQENSARGAVQQARQEADEAAERTRRMDEAIGARPRPEPANAVAFAATMWARQAMAADLSAALAIAGHRNTQVDDRAADLMVAATRHRTVEKLAERHAEAQRHADDMAAQLEADDRATSRSRGGDTKQ
jgi:flagellar biosynthesis chaperone FliJ